MMVKINGASNLRKSKVGSNTSTSSWFFSIDGAALEFSALFGIRRFFFVLLFFVRTEFDVRAYGGVPLLGTPWILCLIITMARIMITNSNPIKLCTWLSQNRILPDS